MQPHDLFNREQFISSHAENCANSLFAWEGAFFACQFHLAAQQVYQVLRIALIEHRKHPMHSSKFSVLTQRTMSYRMKRAAGDALAAFIGKRNSAGEHTLSRPAREGQQQD